MLTTEEFEILVGRPESSILDFKANMYDFQDDGDYKSSAKLVKDVISFANTVRSETSYILIGIKENQDGSKELLGIDKPMDDAMLQEKIKDKVYPRPTFNYYTVSYKNKRFGVFEFPIKKYVLPISPSIRMKGLEVGRFYYRQGTTNTEALGQEAIRINNWLQSLPEILIEEALYTDVTSLLKRITGGVEKLSSIFADAILLSRKYSLKEFLVFCTREITGIQVEGAENEREELKYRVETIIISTNNIGINPYARATSSSIKTEMENSDEFYDYPLLFIQPISEIEGYLNRNDGIATIKMSSKNIFPEITSDYPVYGYIFKDMFETVYKNIRQKAIDNLMRI